jgi:hypothetical protein
MGFGRVRKLELSYNRSMRVLPPVEEEIRRVVRDERAKDPLITVAGLEHALEKHFDRGFSHQYVSKIADKVAREGLVAIDRTRIEERLALTRDNYRLMREELLKIVYWTPENAPEGSSKPRAQDRIEAAKNVVMMDLALLSAEVANGLYRKPIEMLAKEIHYEPLPGEVRAVIVAAWTRGGMLPRATIEEMVPQRITSQELSDAH